MNRAEYYCLALQNLGFFPTLNLQLQRKFRQSRRLELSSRLLRHTVYARPKTSDLDVFAQIFIEREYRCLDGLDLNGLIVDLGANVGYSASYLLSRFPKCSLIAVEPDPANYACAVDNLQHYDDRCRVFHAAVWPRKESLSFEVGSMKEGMEWGRRVRNDVSGSIPIIAIPEILDMAGQRIALLKVDIEGAEIELFRHAEQWIDKVDNIVIELHGEEAGKIFHSAIEHRKFLVSRCYELTVCLGQVPPLQSDVLGEPQIKPACLT